MSAYDSITVSGGTDDSRIGVLINLMIADQNQNYVMGGTLDTARNGRIDIVSTDSILIRGVVGQKETDQANVDFGRARWARSPCVPPVATSRCSAT
ncbi:hypothetical protein HK414_16020 [Ramlibacter terrae]|uniref:Uncharacterized protein n=1 Tax=Ramlibacter terrae TaxID=2732511 RepID=A0ABX6P6A2_9BURK|nr:hypothetical protein HK414_16020 [Ramlibacter terrae]